MNNININLRLRPIRFAFLVRPNDARHVQEVFRINTCLWGGKYNPIIPFFKKLPHWWERKGIRFENAKQVINGYLDFFEPDFLVEAEKGLANDFGFDPERVLKLTDLLIRGRSRSREKYGFDVNDLYKDLYRKEFQFERRHEDNIVFVRAESPSFANFVSCLFGDFPTQRSLKYFEKNFKSVFGPNEVILDPESLLKIYRSGAADPLRIAHAKLTVDYHDHLDPTLFILDASQPKDLIDFWNLRATHRNVIAIPVQWLEELSSFCKKFIKRNYRPLPGNSNGVMIQPTSMFSRSIADEDIEEIHKKYLRVDTPDANLIQTWYPPIWRETPGYAVRTMRPTLYSEKKSIDLQINESNPEVQFHSLSPDFASQYGGKCRWANVVRLRSWGNSDLVATVFPCNYKRTIHSKLRLGGEFLQSTVEGLVFYPEYKDIQERWNLVDGPTTLNSWFKQENITARLSDAGRATQQIIRTLGGFWGVSSLAHKGVVEFFNEMSRKPVTKSAHHQEFRNKIDNAITDEFLRERNFKTLVERKAVELGLELKCTICGSWSWHSLASLDHLLSCDLCLKEFPFPITAPTDSNLSRWAYRLAGPFALPDYARGGYSAALSIRFFGQVLGGMDNSITWSSGQELTFGDGKKSEADFIIWSQRKQMFGQDYPTEIVFGEAKSFGNDVFKSEDVTKMKLLAQSFPGSIIVFSALKDGSELSSEEKERLIKIAQWGREYDKERKQSRAPVIILTGLELFTAHYLRTSWEDKGGRHNELIKAAWARIDNLRVLADLTQQLYLGMPSYAKWREDKWRKRQKC